jgi:hypothetical protein
MIFVALLLACTPTCEEACRKLVECENPGTELLGVDACEEQCREQRDLYAEWDDQQLIDAFDDSLSCYTETSCDSLASGACYNEAIWSY